MWWSTDSEEQQLTNYNQGNDEIQANDLLDTLIVSTIPTSFLMASMVIALFWPIDAELRCRLANFSAGILLSAIFTELYPLLEHVLGLDGHGHYFVMLSMFVGFLCAFIFLHLIDFLPSHRLGKSLDEEYGYDDAMRHMGQDLRVGMTSSAHSWKGAEVTPDNAADVAADLKDVLEAIEKFETGVRKPEANRNATEVYRQSFEGALAVFRNTICNQPPSISLSKQRTLLEDLARIKMACHGIQVRLSKDKPHKRNRQIRELLHAVGAATVNIGWEMRHHEHSACSAAIKYIKGNSSNGNFDNVRPPGCPSSVGTSQNSQISRVPDDTSSAQQLAGLPSVPSARHLKNISGQTDRDMLIAVGLTTKATSEDDSDPPGTRDEYESLSKSASNRGKKARRKGSTKMTFKRDTQKIINSLAAVIVCGFLIGLSYTISERAGYIVSCGATLEMFLQGTKYAHAHNFSSGTAACRDCGVFTGLFVVPPMTLTLSTMIGSGISASMTADEYIFHGFMTFGIASVTLHLGKSLFAAHLDGLKRMTLDDRVPGMTFLGSFLPFAGVYVTWTISALAPNDTQN